MNELRETLLKLDTPKVLALNAYFEAAAEYKAFGSDALVGPMAVVLNRWQHPSDWQDSIQEVVAAHRQFSWTNWDTIKDPQYPQALRFAKTLLAQNEVDSPVFLVARGLAVAMIEGRASNPVANSTFYYNPKVCNPAWAKALKEIAVIGHHRFMAAPKDPAVLWDPAVNYLKMEGNNMTVLGTKNFSPDEWRCKCCGELPPQWKDGEVPPILSAYQQYRDKIGKPVIITPHGGYRCPHQNKISGGAADSRHLHGDAGDSTVAGMTSEEMAAEAETIPEFQHGGIGIYPGRGFVHLDVRGHKSRWQG